MLGKRSGDKKIQRHNQYNGNDEQETVFYEYQHIILSWGRQKKYIDAVYLSKALFKLIILF